MNFPLEMVQGNLSKQEYGTVKVHYKPANQLTIKLCPGTYNNLVSCLMASWGGIRIWFRRYELEVYFCISLAWVLGLQRLDNGLTWSSSDHVSIKDQNLYVKQMSFYFDTLLNQGRPQSVTPHLVSSTAKHSMPSLATPDLKNVKSVVSMDTDSLIIETPWNLMMVII